MMKRKVKLTCSQGVTVEIEADVMRGIAIHRPIYFELNENDEIVRDEHGDPVYKIGDHSWRLTHVNSGLLVMLARTKTAALKARKVLADVDLDRAATMDEADRLTLLPADHPLHKMMNDGERWLPPGWDWE